MNTQPYMLENLNIERRSDLYDAATETRRVAYARHGSVGRDLLRSLTALFSRRTDLGTGAAASKAQPVAGH